MDLKLSPIPRYEAWISGFELGSFHRAIWRFQIAGHPGEVPCWRVGGRAGSGLATWKFWVSEAEQGLVFLLRRLRNHNFELLLARARKGRACPRQRIHLQLFERCRRSLGSQKLQKVV